MGIMKIEAFSKGQSRQTGSFLYAETPKTEEKSYVKTLSSEVATEEL